MDREVEIVLRDQHRRRESKRSSQFRPHRAHEGQRRGRRDCVIHAEAAGVMQRVLEVAQCLRGPTQGVLGLTQVSKRLTQRPEGPAPSFSCAREGFVGQVF